MSFWKEKGKRLFYAIAVFLGLYFMPLGNSRFDHAVVEALALLKWYAREHVLLCLIPAFFIAGGISVFISQASVMKYLGAKANKVLAYGVASVSGTILAVCSCTVLPLFSGIYRMGAGLGPATAFLYSGPAINVLAIVLTASVLGVKIGIARAVGAIGFSIIIGLLMHFIFRREEQQNGTQVMVADEEVRRPLWKNTVYFGLMTAILVFANWGKPAESGGWWHVLYSMKWWLTGILAGALAVVLKLWFEIKALPLILTALATVAMAITFPGRPVIAFVAALTGLSIITGRHKGEAGQWFNSSWGFAVQILPLLLTGVLIAGALLGRPGHEGLIPSDWISRAVGGNSMRSNFLASFAGAFMYFATLTEVPILQGLIGNGMGQGPALALLLAGPALSLPNMLVIHSVMGTKKTIVYVALVIVMATISGYLYGLMGF